MNRNTELINQESFLNYCFERNINDVAYWEKWLKDNPDKRTEIEQLKRIVISMSYKSRHRTINSNYTELQSKIKNLNNYKRNISFSNKKWWAAAAAIVFLFGYIFYYNNNEEKKSIVQVNEVQPGDNKAILILSNGESVNLTDEEKGLVANQTGIQISKTSSGQIIYSKTSNSKKLLDNKAYNIIKVPVGGQFQISLSDGTKVWLNSLSTLKFPVEFKSNERLVELTGEAYFEVSHKKGVPFRVKSNNQLVNVIGTHFNVNSYSDEKVVRTTLTEGAVEILAKKDRVKIKPGEMAELSENGIEVSEVDVEEMIAWKNGYFKFNDDLEGAMRKISRWYDVDIVYTNNKTINEPIYFGGAISRSKKLSAVLKIMESTKRVNFKIEGRKVIVIK